MARWFGSSQQETMPVSNPPGQDWPPTFETYTDYKKKLDEAIASHPPFGDWLRSYRTKAHIAHSECVHNTCVPNTTSPDMWFFTVQQLKERYVISKTRETHTKNMKRAIADLHLEKEAEEYEQAKNNFASAQQAFDFAIEKYEGAIAHGYHTRRPVPPSANAQLLQYMALEQIVKDE